MSVQFAPSPAPLHAAARAVPFAKAAHDPAARSSELRASGPVQSFSADEEIFSEGDDAAVFFRVVTGVVRTCKFMNDGRRQVEAFHVAGDLVGFEPGEEYGFTAEAVSDCTLVPYRRHGVDALLTIDEALTRQLFAHAMHSLSRAQAHSLLLGRRSAIEKVSAFLTEWAERSPDGRMAKLAMTRQDIADYLGLTIETVSRTLSQLERDGAIELVALREIRLKSPAALHNLNA
jgi:CRP/FNR family nitrogen fixation transcriptional regulator